MKSKTIILFLAAASILLVLADVCDHLSQAWIDRKLLTITKPGDQQFERISDDSRQNLGLVVDGSLVITAQAIVIFLTLRAKHDHVA